MKSFSRSASLKYLVFIVALVLTGCNVESPEADQLPGEQPAETASTESMDRLNLDPAVVGRAAYEQYCMGCHGPDANGGGELEPLLTVTPPDLTMLNAKYNGAFPEETIRKMVDGREIVPAHGTREMPIWGNIWVTVDGDTLDEAIVNRRVSNLITYLKSIQVEV